MGLFRSSKKDEKNQSNQAPDGPPSYDELQQVQYGAPNEQTPQYSGNYGPNEYPQEKKSSSQYSEDQKQSQYQGQDQSQFQGQFQNDNQFQGQYQDQGQYQGQNQNQYGNGTYTIPANTYLVAPQLVNIAYETDGKYTRPGYVEYLQNDPQRVAQGNGPLPRQAFGRGGAPLAPGNKSSQKTGGGAFPGSSKTTYHNAANR